MGKAKKEKKAPIVLTPEEVKSIKKRVVNAVRAAKESTDDGAYDKAVKELCDIADKLKYHPMWVYHRLSDEKNIVNTRAIHSIARAKNYDPYWTKKQAERIHAQIEQAREVLA
jgi:hypothetical protein